MNYLTKQQRVNALACLATAPDEVILSAMVDYKSHMHRLEGIKRNFDETLTELNGEASVIEEAPTATNQKNVNPGTPSIGKIGSATRQELLNQLVNGIVPAPKFKEHLKLLWSRNEVKFDGDRYYV